MRQNAIFPQSLLIIFSARQPNLPPTNVLHRYYSLAALLPSDLFLGNASLSTTIILPVDHLL